MGLGSVFDRAGARRGTPAEFLVVGLGNPGSDYRGTRHNVGVEVVEILSRRHARPGTDGELRLSKPERALTAEVEVEGHRVALAFPQTYMNLSGEAVSPLVKRHGIVDPRQIVVVHDEIDLVVGGLRVKVGGGNAGHNGLRSIDLHIGSRDYARVRVGVGRPTNSRAGRDHVLKVPSKAERSELDVIVEEAADAVECYLLHGIDETMNRFNRRVTK
ncbi:MAG: aminoacyl-tRNA hydrolase [Actinomycetia bacterium]|nr:aminoacyl-tRNA hydrolase [Actinomycetes bacterium]MCP4961226.1 aminoacyl-tRNA hydrolase [Actinomycetes bacterium]